MTVAVAAEARHRPAPAFGMLLAVLGVVYGDIGTSPLYAFKASLQHFTPGNVTNLEIMGILSLIFWSLVLVVTVKYVLLILRADNRGEGGILALMALAQRVSVGSRVRNILTLIGIVGACLFFGDGVITPAISVLSAVEGLEVSAPELKQYVLPISVVVILVLFAVQSRGTGSVGRVFGPIMAVWFLSIGLLGIWEIVQHPFVLLALSPSYAATLCLHHGLLAFVVLGSVVLCVTGAEALYADMGHFGREAIRIAWLFFVLPCLVLNYFGQGALLIAEPDAMANPFFLLGPHWASLPMVILATAATVIASQAMISGAFSMARQCVQLGFLPRLTVRHTSTMEEGQIYLPQVNAMMAVGVTILVLAFKTSDNLAAAYGIAVTGTFLCTSVLATVVFRREFHWSRLTAVAVFGFFFVVDFLFFTSNLLKVPEGGWVPLVLGVALTALMTSWKRGRDLLLARWRQDSLPLAPFLARLPQSRTIRVPGMAVFLTGNSGLRAHVAAAQPQAQQGAARARAVRHGAERRRTGGPGGSADGGVRAGAGHPSGDPALWLHGEPQHPARAGGSQRVGRPVRPDAGELLPWPRRAGAGHGAEDALVAALAVPGAGAQRDAGDGILPHPVRSGGGTRRAGGDLTAAFRLLSEM